MLKRENDFNEAQDCFYGPYEIYGTYMKVNNDFLIKAHRIRSMVATQSGGCPYITPI